MSNRIWLSWENHRRNQSLSNKINAKLIELVADYHRLVRYPLLLVKTFEVMRRECPKYIFVQNPSIVLAIFLVTWGKIIRIPVIVDAHNVGVHFYHSNMLLRFIGQILNILVMKNASLTIITNHSLAKYVNRMNGKPFVLPDPFPIFKSNKKQNLKGAKNILYICTFASDEPYLSLFEAAGYLGENFCIYVTGKYNPTNLPDNMAKNIILTGYIPEAEYIEYLYSVDLIVDLTYREDCLVCGAYEAIAAEKPLILTDTVALREYFENAALYTDNSPYDIYEKIKEAINNASSLTENVKRIKMKREKEWNEKKDQLERVMENL